MSKWLIWILHMCYWLLFFTLLILFYGFIAMAPGFSKLSVANASGFIFWVKLMAGFAVIPAIIAFYSFYTFLFNQYLSKRKFLKFCIAAIVVAFLASVIGAFAESTPLLYGKQFLFNDNYRSAIAILTFMSFGALINGMIGTILKGFITWYNDIRPKEEMLRRNSEMELDLIRAQINPHFLFNTLNNIDVLIDQDPVKASEYLKKLSEILRFMLYETKTEKIAATKELEYIQKYLALQQLRNANPAFVDFAVKGIPRNHFTEPMLFIPFIENAFKYADNKNQVNAIRIRFLFSDEEISFTCENNYSTEKSNGMDAGGLGNTLIKKRLELLYPGLHQLFIDSTNNRYCVKLILQNPARI